MVAGGLVPQQKGADCMNWISITDKNKKDIRIGDFISTIYGKGIIYKVLFIGYYMGKMLLDVGVCDKNGNIERENCIYYGQDILFFNAYSPRNRKAQVV